MPGGLICPHCRRYTSADDSHCNHCGKLTGGAVFSRLVRSVGGVEIPGTKFLLGLCVAMYGVEMVLSTKLGQARLFGPSPDALVMLGANMNYEQFWRVASAVLLHGNLLHIGMNGLGLIALGRTIEERSGAARMITAFFLTGIAGFGLSLWLHGGNTFSVGASGGLFGLVGADLGHVIAKRIAGARALVTRSIIFAVLWSLLPMIDFWAHMGGLATGLAFGWLLANERRASARDALFAATAVVLTSLSLAAVVLSVSNTPQTSIEQGED